MVSHILVFSQPPENIKMILSYWYRLDLAQGVEFANP